MKLGPYAVPAGIGIAALAAIWYIAKQNAPATVAPAASTAGNDTINPASASGATPASTTTAGTTKTGTSATMAAPAWGITSGGW